MDSVIIEALVETRRVLEHLDLAAAERLRSRRDVLERAARAIELRGAPREDVISLARLIIDVREEAVALERAHRVVVEAVRDVIV